MASIQVTSLGGTSYHVKVEDRRGCTEHEVTATSDDLDRYGPGLPAERVIERSFEFLLAREPKESILRQFALPVIEHYFPEYLTEMRSSR
jgi:hypothetical protein